MGRPKMTPLPKATSLDPGGLQFLKDRVKEAIL